MGEKHPLLAPETPAAAISCAIRGICTYYGALMYFALGGRYDDCAALTTYPLRTRVHLYHCALNFWLWSRPHYRTGTHQGDMLKNLRNVAIPGTGVPLHVFVYLRPLAWLFLLVVYPLAALVAAVHRARIGDEGGGVCGAATCFLEQLLAPEDWFTYWRMNSNLASYHSLLCDAPGYAMENKWQFLSEGARVGVPVSPFLDAGELVIKDRNEEGGMGIFFYKNATVGGDWIIQRRLENSDFLKTLLPESAPLSTFRVMTASTWSAQEQLGEGAAGGAAANVRALSCVFRAGRAGASTDHSSVLFDVDCATGTLKRGTTNDHWYKLGLNGARSCPWLSRHDQVGSEGRRVTGRDIPDFGKMLEICIDSHFTLLRDVPLVGWDVALCGAPDEGQWLLEVNLSCNFFRGSFDKDAYFEFMDDYLKKLEPRARAYAQTETLGKKRS